MNDIYEVFNVKSDLQLNNLFENLDLTPSEMIQMDEIISQYGSLKDKREKILEMMSYSSDENYSLCKKIFSQQSGVRRLKEDVEQEPLNMNKVTELNDFFILASKKFQEVNCAQAFYSMLSQKLSKNFANAFFNTLKTSNENSELKYDPDLMIDGKNFAQALYPFINELTNYLNSCKKESKKEEVNENYEIGNKVQGKGKNQGTYIIDSIKDGFYNLRNIYDQNRNRLYPVSKKTLDEEFKLINESLEDDFHGNYTHINHYEDKEISFNDIKEFAEKYDLIPTNKNENANNKTYAKFITYPKSMNFNNFKKDALKKFGNNIEVIKGTKLKNNRFIVGIWYNGIDKLNESLEDTLKNFEYYIATSSSKDELSYMKNKLSLLFNNCNDTGDRNNIAELLSQINSKMSNVKPTINECCCIDSLLEPFKATVVNITVNDDGCLNDCEKELATSNLKALASHINDKKDCCEENNIERMQTITSLLSSLANFFHKRLCESVDKNEDYEELDESFNHFNFDVGDKVEDKKTLKVWTITDIEPNWVWIKRDFDGSRQLGDVVCKEGFEDRFILFKKNKLSQWAEYSGEDTDLDEDTVFDHSWYEVEGQKYPKRTKNGVEIKEGIKDWFKKDNDDRTFVIKLAKSGYFCKDGKSINGDINDAMIITGYKNALKQANKLNKYEGTDAFKPIEIKHEYTSEYEYLDEMCSGGACCAGAVATIPSPVKPKSIKRKKKKSKVDEMALNMFKRQIIEDINSQIDINGNHYEFRDGYFYINGNIAKTTSKYLMLEALDDVFDLKTLQGFNSEEMNLLEDIEASGDIGDDTNDSDDNTNNNSNNNNNSQNNINQDNLGDVEQNVTNDNDLTPQQRQLKKDTERTLDQSMSGSNDVDVSVNQGFDNNNDQMNNQNTSSDNVKYKLIGKDDTDQNNIKYIIQDPTTKKTKIVDATKLRLEK